MEHPDYRPRNLPVRAKAIYDSSGNIIKLIGTSVDFDFKTHPWSVAFKGGTIVSDGADLYITTKSANLYLGGKTGDSFAAVETTAGPSRNVFAAI